eukprot:m.36021 g.36021  ORF g.36021 m.36021 type:complete len:372 (+) comp17242_c0_seq1:119-1234(+)
MSSAESKKRAPHSLDTEVYPDGGIDDRMLKKNKTGETLIATTKEESEKKNKKKAKAKTGSEAPAPSSVDVVKQIKESKAFIKDLCNELDISKCAATLCGKVTEVVSAKRSENVNAGRMGSVQLGKCWRGQKKADIPHDPTAITVYVSKGKGHLGTHFSPFVLKVPHHVVSKWTLDGQDSGMPLPINKQGWPLELVWQAAKATKDEVVGTGKLKKPSAAYFKRRAVIYKRGIPKRRYFEKGSAVGGAVFGNHDAPLLQWVESRYFYCQQYERAVESSDEFKLLKGILNAGFNLLLLGPDGFPVVSPSLTTITQAYSSTRFPFGHERVLMAMLMGCRPWDKNGDGDEEKKQTEPDKKKNVGEEKGKEEDDDDS